MLPNISMSKPVTSSVKAHDVNSYVDKGHCCIIVVARGGSVGGGGCPPKFCSPKFCYPKSKVIHV